MINAINSLIYKGGHVAAALGGSRHSICGHDKDNSHRPCATTHEACKC